MCKRVKRDNFKINSRFYIVKLFIQIKGFNNGGAAACRKYVHCIIKVCLFIYDLKIPILVSVFIAAK